MDEALKELGKHLLNLALAVAVYLLIQPFLKEKFSFKVFIIGFLFYMLLASLGFLLIIFGSKLSNKED